MGLPLYVRVVPKPDMPQSMDLNAEWIYNFLTFTTCSVLYHVFIIYYYVYATVTTGMSIFTSIPPASCTLMHSQRYPTMFTNNLHSITHRTLLHVAACHVDDQSLLHITSLFR